MKHFHVFSRRTRYGGHIINVQIAAHRLSLNVNAKIKIDVIELTCVSFYCRQDAMAEVSDFRTLKGENEKYGFKME